MMGVPIFPAGIVKQYLTPKSFIDNLDLSQLHYFGNYICPPYPESDCAGNVEGHNQNCSP